jgi:hypothetical protein
MFSKKKLDTEIRGQDNLLGLGHECKNSADRLGYFQFFIANPQKLQQKCFKLSVS